MNNLLKVFITLFIIYTALIPESARAELQKVGTVGAINPKVTAENKKNVISTETVTRSLNIKDDIFFKDKIETDENGNTQLLFIDKSALTVGPHSSLVIDEFVYNPADSGGEMTINSTKGTFRFIGGALSKKKAVKIKTPVSTIGIRGGIAVIEIEEGTGATEAIFIFGEEMTVENLDGTVQSTTTSGSVIQVATPSSEPTSPAPVSRGVLAKKMSKLQGKSGTSGGAEKVPDEKTIDKKMNLDLDKEEAEQSEKEEKSGSKQNSSTEKKQDEGEDNEAEAGDEGDNDEAADKKSDESGKNNDGENKKSTAPEKQEKSNSIGSKNESKDSFAAERRESFINDNRDINDNKDVAKKVATEDKQRDEETTQGGTSTSSASGSGGGAPGTGGDNAPETDDGGADSSSSGGSDPVTGGGSGSSSGATGSFAPNAIHTGRLMARSTAGGAATNKGNIVTAPPANGGFAATYTESGTSSTTTLPAPTQAGRTSFSGSVLLHPAFSNPFTSGNIFASDNGTMTYYFLKETISGKNISIAMGTPIISALLPASGVKGYDFLPDLRMLDSGSSTALGFFNYNYINSGLLPSGVGSQHDTGIPGMIVDWSNNIFISSAHDFDFTSPTSHHTNFKLAFGKINRSSSTKLFGGDTASESLVIEMFDSAQGSEADAGFIRVHPNYIFGNGVTGVDGFVLETSLPVDDGSPVFNEATIGPKYDVPAMKVSNGVTLNNMLSAGRNSKTLKGYAAGFIVADPGEDQSAKTYMNTDPAKVIITTNAANGLIDADVTVQATDDSGNKRKADFGGASTINAFVSDKIYATSQRTYTNADGTGGGDIKGALVSSFSMSDIQCSACQFTQWGFWAANIEDNAVGSGNTEISLTPYAVGSDITTNLGSAGLSSAIARYDGIALANIYHDGGNVSGVHNGTFSASVNFGTRAFSNMDIDIQSAGIANLGFNNIGGGGVFFPETGPATIDNIPLNTGTIGGVNITSGTANASLYGPGAQDMAGNFQFSAPSDISGAGVFLGHTGDTTP